MFYHKGPSLYYAVKIEDLCKQAKELLDDNVVLDSCNRDYMNQLSQFDFSIHQCEDLRMTLISIRNKVAESSEK